MHHVQVQEQSKHLHVMHVSANALQSLKTLFVQKTSASANASANKDLDVIATLEVRGKKLCNQIKLCTFRVAAYKVTF